MVHKCADRCSYQELRKAVHKLDREVPNRPVLVRLVEAQLQRFQERIQVAIQDRLEMWP